MEGPGSYQSLTDSLDNTLANLPNLRLFAILEYNFWRGRLLDCSVPCIQLNAVVRRLQCCVWPEESDHCL